MRLPYSLIKPLLFSMDPEKAHALTFKVLDRLESWDWLRKVVEPPERLPVEVMGLPFPNPIGLAAGLDKNAAHIDALTTLGFGFIEVGTVTPRPQPGNPAPRLFRLPAAQALINRMGFNNQGTTGMLGHIMRSKFTGVLGINIGKNAATPIEQAAADYVAAMRDIYPFASYIAVNVSSPNTQNLRSLQGGDGLKNLLSTLADERKRLADEHGAYRPMALKIAPDLNDHEIDWIADCLVQYGFDAIIATNTTLDRSQVQGLQNAQESGGLSGAPLQPRAVEVVAKLHRRLGRQTPIIGVGGILRGSDACELMQAGASLVQIYTGFIYRGPALISECVDALQAARLVPRHTS